MMEQKIAEVVKNNLKDKIVDFFKKNDRRYYIEISPKDIIECSKYLFDDLGCRFSTATGIDCEKHIEILYHFSYDKTGEFITLRVKLDKVKPEIDSLTRVFPAAEWIEREIWEMLGVNFNGHPNLKHLLLPDDWPEGKHPLRE